MVDKAREAFKTSGDVFTTDWASYGCGILVPRKSLRRLEEFKANNPSGGFGHAALAVAPFAAGPIAEAAGPALDVAAETAKGAVRGATETIPINRFGMKVNVPAPIAGAAAGGVVGGLSHIPMGGEIGAAIGAAAPIVRGGIRGFRTAVEAARPPAPFGPRAVPIWQDSTRSTLRHSSRTRAQISRSRALGNLPPAAAGGARGHSASQWQTHTGAADSTRPARLQPRLKRPQPRLHRPFQLLTISRRGR